MARSSPILAEAVAAGSVRERLRGEPVEPVFAHRRLQRQAARGGPVREAGEARRPAARRTPRRRRSRTCVRPRRRAAVGTAVLARVEPGGGGHRCRAGCSAGSTAAPSPGAGAARRRRRPRARACASRRRASSRASSRTRRCWACAADVTDPAAVDALRDAVLARCGRIDVLVNNAALDDKVEAAPTAAEASPLRDLPPRALATLARRQRHRHLPLLPGAWARRWRGAARGSIVNVASTYGAGRARPVALPPPGRHPDLLQVGRPTRAPRARCSRSPATSPPTGAHRGVRVNALSPGGVENGQDAAVRRRATRRARRSGAWRAPDDYAGALVFLASDASSYMTGANLVVDGGWTAW